MLCVQKNQALKELKNFCIDLQLCRKESNKQGPTGSRYPTRPEHFFKYPTRPNPEIENDWVLGN